MVSVRAEFRGLSVSAKLKVSTMIFGGSCIVRLTSVITNVSFIFDGRKRLFHLGGLVGARLFRSIHGTKGRHVGKLVCIKATYDCPLAQGGSLSIVPLGRSRLFPTLPRSTCN